jgi:hypothetical protein
MNKGHHLHGNHSLRQKSLCQKQGHNYLNISDELIDNFVKLGYLRCRFFKFRRRDHSKDYFLQCD